MASDHGVRSGRAGDAPEIARLADELRAHLGDPIGHLTADGVLRDGFGPNPEFDVIVAEEHEGRLVGYALFYEVYEPGYAARGLYMADLYVAAAARGRGLGRRLIEAVADVARARGRTYVWWLVQTQNAAALAFYDRLAPQYRNEVVSHALLIGRSESSP